MHSFKIREEDWKKGKKKKHLNLYSRLPWIPFTVDYTETGEISPWYRIQTKLWDAEMCHKSTSNTEQKINN